MKLSVIICTHNPRPDHLARTLAGLRAQTLPATEWELIVVDNASSQPLDAAVATWHPHARVCAEPRRGLPSARLRGLAEAGGELIVFVDDDNVLAPDYLATAARIAAAEPELGAFGGQIHGEFERPPKPWFAARLDRLAIREFSAPAQSRQPDPAVAPCGAGLCVRTAVGRRYREIAQSDPRRLALGRSGRQLAAGDDLDLAFTACDLGLEIGRRPELRLTHLIPADRLTLRYFAGVTRGHAKASLQLEALRPGSVGFRDGHWRARLAYWKWSVIAGVIALRKPARSAR